MNAPATLTDVPTLNRAFIHQGLARFGREHLAAPSGVFERLGGDGALFALLGTPRDDWLAACTALARRAPGLPGPWGGILHDYQLQLHEWFAFALAGEAESSHLVNLALAELQAPGASPRPGLHLLEAMSLGLFAAPLPPLAWANHPLVRHHLAEIEGDLPLPLASLRVPARLWALCSGDSRLWPDFQPITPRPGQALPASLEDRIVLTAELVRRGDLRVIVIRGTRPAGFAVASRLAAALGLAPVESSAEAWSSHPLLATACRYAGWLPVLALELGPGDRFAPGPEAPRQAPMVLIAGQDGTVEATDVLELTIPPLDRDERLAAWRQALGPDAPPPLADHALVDGPSIHVLAGRMRHAAAHRDEAPGLQHLRAARADHGAERLRILAQPVSRQVGPDGLVLPAETARQFEQLLCRCTMRERLWSGLGASLAAPTPGVRALFAGESGAGKTLAASRLATELANAEVSVYTLMKLLGHESMSMSQRYVTAAGADRDASKGWIQGGSPAVVRGNEAAYYPARATYMFCTSSFASMAARMR